MAKGKQASTRADVEHRPHALAAKLRHSLEQKRAHVLRPRRTIRSKGEALIAWSAHDAASRLSQAHLQAAPMPFRPSQASLDTLARL